MEEGRTVGTTHNRLQPVTKLQSETTYKPDSFFGPENKLYCCPKSQNFIYSMENMDTTLYRPKSREPYARLTVSFLFKPDTTFSHMLLPSDYYWESHFLHFNIWYVVSAVFWIKCGVSLFCKSSHSVSISTSLCIPTLLARWVINYIGVFSTTPLSVCLKRWQFRRGFGWMQLRKWPLCPLLSGHHVWM